MQQALHKRLDSWLRFQKPAKEKTQQSRPRDSIRLVKARSEEWHGQGDKGGKARQGKEWKAKEQLKAKPTNIL